MAETGLADEYSAEAVAALLARLKNGWYYSPCPPHDSDCRDIAGVPPSSHNPIGALASHCDRPLAHSSPIGPRWADSLSTTPLASLYVPESPFGVFSVAYDPASPIVPWNTVANPLSGAGRAAAEDAPSVESSAGNGAQPEPKTGQIQKADAVSANYAAVQHIVQVLSALPRASLAVPIKQEQENGNSHSAGVDDVEPAQHHVPPGHTAGADARLEVVGVTTICPTKGLRDVPKSHATKNSHPQEQPLKPKALSVSREPASRCCPVEVPSILLMILDRRGVKLDPHMIDQYAMHSNRLCQEHLEKYQYLKASLSRPLSQPLSRSPSQPLSQPPSQPYVATPPSCTENWTAKERSGGPGCLAPARPSPKQSLLCRDHDAMASWPSEQVVRQQSEISPLPLKKRKRAGRLPRATHAPAVVGCGEVRPVANAVRDSKYCKEMLKEIEDKAAEAGGTGETHGAVTDRMIHTLLSVAKLPNTSPDLGPVEVHFLTGDEARAMLDRDSPVEPIVTEREQTFKWQPQQRPIAELFQRMENLDRRVSVQVPSRHCMGDSFESRDLVQVRDRFLANDETDDPWNVLDLRSPLPAAVLPQFLTSENCQLLPRLRDEVLNPGRAERDTATRDQWNEWRNVLEWVLLSQGGHNTSPHTDSHGLATWITVQEGLFGFGWMSRPTREEHEQWMADPQGFTGGNWRFFVLEPGQTVFFNSGTVHFVFRLRAQHTLALGGHVLQWSGIERWLRIVAAQMKNPNITNEDMEWSAPKYVRVVARLVAMRLQNHRVEELGGEAAVRRLLEQLKRGI